MSDNARTYDDIPTIGPTAADARLLPAPRRGGASPFGAGSNQMRPRTGQVGQPSRLTRAVAAHQLARYSGDRQRNVGAERTRRTATSRSC